MDKRGQDVKVKCNEIKEIDNETDYNKFFCVHTDGKIYNFTISRRLADLASIYYANYKKISNDEMDIILSDLNKYKSQNR